MRSHPPSILCICTLLAGCLLDVELGEIREPPVPQLPPPTAACISISPQVISFGEVAVGDEQERAVTLKNNCEQAVTVTSIELSGDTSFTIDASATSSTGEANANVLHRGEPHSVAPGESVTVKVTFRPFQRALARGEIIFQSPLGLMPISVIGNPAGPCLEIIPRELNIGCQITGTTSWRPVTLRNCGQVAAKVEALSFNDRADTLFSLGVVDLPIVIESGQEQEVSIGYSPGTASTDIAPTWDTADLMIDTLGYATPLTVPLRGFGKSFSCEGLRVVLVWVTPGDPDPKDRGPEAGSDMDLHLLHPFAVDFFDIPFDTYWYNANPQWGIIDDPIDDPVLSLDDYDSLGPETIVLPLPENDFTYTVGVHYWSDHDFGPSRAQVQVSLFGELVYESPLVEMVSGELWEVATVTWPSGEVIELTNPEGESLVHRDFVAPCDVISCGK